MAELELIAQPGKQELTTRRVFAAPRALVFQAHIDPDLIPKWWGPSRYTTIVDKLDAKAGGSWRFVQRGPDGDEHAFHGVFHEVIAPELLIYTFEYEGMLMPHHVSLETGRFVEHDGRTTLSGISAFQSVEDRDGMVESGMEEGASESMDRLVELLRTMA